MQNIQQLIEQARAVMTCPVCGRHYDAKEISFKGFMEHTYILQASCSTNHAAVFTTWITSYAPTIKTDFTPISEDYIIELHQALKRFDGNFKALWQNER